LCSQFAGDRGKRASKVEEEKRKERNFTCWEKEIEDKRKHEDLNNNRSYKARAVIAGPVQGKLILILKAAAAVPAQLRQLLSSSCCCWENGSTKLKLREKPVEKEVVQEKSSCRQKKRLNMLN
jgi:hypothetical protein